MFYYVVIFLKCLSVYESQHLFTAFLYFSINKIFHHICCYICGTIKSPPPPRFLGSFNMLLSTVYATSRNMNLFLPRILASLLIRRPTFLYYKKVYGFAKSCLYCICHNWLYSSVGGLYGMYQVSACPYYAIFRLNGVFRTFAFWRKEGALCSVQPPFPVLSLGFTRLPYIHSKV